MLWFGTIVMPSSFNSAGLKTPDAAELRRLERCERGEEDRAESLITDDIDSVQPSVVQDLFWNT